MMFTSTNICFMLPANGGRPWYKYLYFLLVCTYIFLREEIFPMQLRAVSTEEALKRR